MLPMRPVAKLFSYESWVCHKLITFLVGKPPKNGFSRDCAYCGFSNGFNWLDTRKYSLPFSSGPVAFWLWVLHFDIDLCETNGFILRIKRYKLFIRSLS